jgi:hypothetical protein
MAVYVTIDSTRGSHSSRYSSVDHIGSLGSLIIAGFGAFGLAANGMCPPLPDQSLAIGEIKAAICPDKEAEKELFLVACKTVAFIVQGIRKMCALEGREISRSTLLIIGATGDVGSGCARCLAPFVKRVMLYARNVGRLGILATELETDGNEVEVVTRLEQVPFAADLVICAASLPSSSLRLGRIAPKAIICDAGYPKNLSPRGDMTDARVFCGGLGQISGGLTFMPDFKGVLDRHPFPDVAHGCLLEGMALALARRFEPFTQGRGFITRERVEEIETIAALHGIHLAPLYNAEGPLEACASKTARSGYSSGAGEGAGQGEADAACDSP